MSCMYACWQKVWKSLVSEVMEELQMILNWNRKKLPRLKIH